MSSDIEKKKFGIAKFMQVKEAMGQLEDTIVKSLRFALPSHLNNYDAMTEKKIFCRNCFCSDDLEDILSELVADYGDVDNFVLSLQNCRFFDHLVFDSHGHDNCHVCGHVYRFRSQAFP